MKKQWRAKVYKDPVCEMLINQNTAAATCEHEGKTYYFCAPVCRDAFELAPERYIGKWPHGESA